ncbi:hypothetical protein BSZ14_05045 [Sphingomonas sp. Sph1(2015)]|jgi:spore coat protein U-like protein|uniref:spore coat protein U domain-containing protein n=1 Tax=Sphingomonas sp. Sph1(2015) TaxID=1628084 RepID=UPI000976A583|nr:spore coat protein U domain-containing protein [Sphingomonas sp. Sph1(2015)]OMJ32973.1 hypothetical protein BSZ14_05045 [Sphingomonas sp. Sph1(2015)]
MMKKTITAALAGVSMLAAAPAFAASSNPGTLNVKLNVTTGCDINGNGGIGAGSGAAAELNFGSYAAGVAGSGGGAGTPTTVTGVDTGNGLVVTCSGTQTPSLSFDGGLNAVGTQRNLKQVNGTGTLAYTLGSAAGGTQYGVNTPVALSAFTAGQARVVKVFGSVPGGVPAGAEGAYADTVQISMTW